MCLEKCVASCTFVRTKIRFSFKSVLANFIKLGYSLATRKYETLYYGKKQKTMDQTLSRGGKSV